MNIVSTTCTKCGTLLNERKLTVHKFIWKVNNRKMELGVKLNAKYCKNHLKLGDDLSINLGDIIAFGDDVMGLTKQIHSINTEKELNNFLNKLSQEQEKYTVEILS